LLVPEILDRSIIVQYILELCFVHLTSWFEHLLHLRILEQHSREHNAQLINNIPDSRVIPVSALADVGSGGGRTAGADHGNSYGRNTSQAGDRRGTFTSFTQLCKYPRFINLLNV
jgi:hypothetical protein